jgi:hypothetical protein
MCIDKLVTSVVATLIQGMFMMERPARHFKKHTRLKDTLHTGLNHIAA